MSRMDISPTVKTMRNQASWVDMKDVSEALEYNDNLQSTVQKDSGQVSSQIKHFDLKR